MHLDLEWCWSQSQELAAAEQKARGETTQAVISLKDSYQSLSADLEENMKMFTQCAPQPKPCTLKLAGPSCLVALKPATESVVLPLC